MNNDTISQGARNARSPGQRSVGALPRQAPSMCVLRSTKKLTKFREFAITPASKDAPGYSSLSALISPHKLKKLERRHGVQLLGGASNQVTDAG